MTQEIQATKFRRYNSLRRIDDRKTKDLLYGEVYVFPKIDGTNSSVWHNGAELCAGSRNRQLSLDNDNAGFFAWVSSQPASDATTPGNLRRMVHRYPNLVFHGEWLVPHTLKTYRDEAWRSFYVFDVYDRETERYLPFETYKEMMNLYGQDYIHPLCIIHNPSEEQLHQQVALNTYLIQDGEGAGEGVVVKNYDWVNYEGYQSWAKIVRNEFKENHNKNGNLGGVLVKQGPNQVNCEIADLFTTPALINKSYHKVITIIGSALGLDPEDPEFEGKVLEERRGQVIPRTLNMVWEDMIEEEILAILKKFKNPTIDFKEVRGRVTYLIKKELPTLF